MEIIINNLSKNYGKRAALEKVSLTIPSGMYGLLGRNGAGKTSLMRILATLSVPSGGEISMNGIPIKETEKIREIVGYLPQDFSFYRNKVPNHWPLIAVPQHFQSEHRYLLRCFY